MLEKPILDDQSFLDIVSTALDQLPHLCGSWTDYNAHDPGITLLELFAWYKEMLQYQMDVTTPAMMERYLKLLGVRRREGRPAQALVLLPGAQPPALREGEAVWTGGGVPFEAAEGYRPGAPRVERILIQTRTARQEVTGILTGEMALPVLQQPGDKLILRLSHCSCSPLTLWIGVRDRYPVSRAPLLGGQPPLRRLRWSGEAGQTLPALRDGTQALYHSGLVTLDLSSLQGAAAPQLQLEMEAASCEEAPEITGVDTRFLRLWQRQRVVQSVEGLGQGASFTLPAASRLAREGACLLLLRDAHGYFPHARFTRGGAGLLVEDAPPLAQDGRPNARAVFYESWFAPYLWRESGGESGLAWELPTGGQQIELGALRVMGLAQTPAGPRYLPWRYAADLLGCGPGARRFCLNETRQGLCFGDNTQGAAAPQGKNALLLCGLAFTLGEKGQLGGDSLTAAGCSFAIRRGDWRPGRDRETLNDAQARLLARLNQPDKAVTLADYARLALCTPGLRVAQATALPRFDPESASSAQSATTVSVAVLPYHPDRLSLPDARYLKRVQAHLERYRMVCVQVKAICPLLLPVDVRVQLLTSLSDADAHQTARQALEAYWRVRPDQPWRLGQMIRESQLIGAVGAAQGVLGVPQLSLSAADARCRKTPAGDLEIPPHALPCLGRVEVHVLRP